MIVALKRLMSWLYGILKPFDVSGYITGFVDALTDYMGWINWLVPFNVLAKIYTAWLLCVSALYIFMFCKPSVQKIIDKVLSLIKRGGGD